MPVWYFVIRNAPGHAAPAVRGFDVDGDTFADVVLGGGILRGSRVPAPAFQPINVALCDAPIAFQGSSGACHDWNAIRPLGDTDGDGFDDAALNRMILRGGPNGFRPEAEGRPCPADGLCDARPIGDTNGDGYLDILMNRSVRLGSLRGFEKHMDLPPFASTDEIHAVGDMDRDGYDDLLAVDRGAGSLTLLRGTSNGFVSGGTCSISTDRTDDQNIHIASADANGDGARDAVVLIVKSNAGRREVMVTIYLGGPGVNLSAATTRRVTWTEAAMAKPSYVGLTTADVDGNGYDDIIVGLESRKGDFRLIRGGADSIRLDPFRAPALEEDGSVTNVSTVGDVDGNGCDDLIVVGKSAADPDATHAHLFLGTRAGLRSSPILVTQSRFDRVPEISKK